MDNFIFYFGGNSITFVETKQKNMALESVKLDSAVVDKVRNQKKKTSIPIGKFIEMAIMEKLLALSKKSK